MRRLWVGMLLASLPFALPAQAQDRRPSRDGWFNPVTPGTSGQRPSGDGWFNPPRPPDEQVAPMPPDETTDQPAPDNPITATPLPPPDQDTPADNSTDPSQQMVPNPLDNPNAPPTQGTTKQAQPQGQPQRGGWVQMGTATLQVLDKINAIGKTLPVKVGDTAHFGSLDIAVRGCFVRTPDRPADATAFLVIRDQRTDAPSFTGWVVRSAPSMSMLAHPIYDVRVTGCS